MNRCKKGKDTMVEVEQPLLRTPVLIVGAGPAGLAASLLLQQYGVPALTIARYGWTAHTPRAHHINPRTMELLRGLGLEEALRSAGMPPKMVTDIVWCVTLAGDELGRLHSYHNPGPEGYLGLTAADSLNIPQHKFEAVLAEALLARRGRLLFNTECLEIRETKSSVQAKVRDRINGAEFWIEADYLIGADGANSLIAEQIGLEFEGDAAWAAAVNVWIKADLTRFCAHRPGLLYFTNHPGDDFWVGSGAFVTVEPWDEWLVALMYDRSEGEPDLSEEALKRRLHRVIGDDSVDIEILNVGKWLMNGQFARTYSSARVFCMGDAVHRHPPTNGLGANISMADAYNLAWKLKLVLAGVAAPSLLESYTTERQPVGREAIRRSMQSAGETAGVAAALGYRPDQSPQQRQEQVLQFRAATEEGATARAGVAAAIRHLRYCYTAVGFELGHRYESGAVVPNGEDYTPSPDPDLVYMPQTAAGTPLPHAIITDQNGRAQSTIDLVAGGAFHLLTGPNGEAWCAVGNEIAEDTGLDLKTTAIGPGCLFDDPYGEWRRIRGVTDSGAVLVRPDGYVAWRADAASETELQALRDAVAVILGVDHTKMSTGDAREVAASDRVRQATRATNVASASTG